MSARARAFLVVDLGFGDAGKGLLCDYLVRKTEAALVVRFNGGAQAGHNVVTAQGQHHTFSQFGSGSFVPGVTTHLASAVVVHPTALATEAQYLARVGVTDALNRISIDRDCRVTTPFHQASNRIRELLRGDSRHGSCGVGFGETVHDSIVSPELTIRFAELSAPEQVRDKLYASRALKLREFREQLEGESEADLRRELAALTDPELPERWLAAAARVARQVSRPAPSSTDLARSDAIVFEGAQGALLDERYGFHPYTTYSRTLFDGAEEQLRGWSFDGEVRRVGVLRAYAVRHGPGPLPTEAAEVTAHTQELHNQTGRWQRGVRKGWPDLVLLDYALRACGSVDCLALTHLDALRALPSLRYCHAYDGVTELAIPRTLAEQCALSALVTAAKPSYRSLTSANPERALLDIVTAHSATRVGFTSYGPRAEDVHSLESWA